MQAFPYQDAGASFLAARDRAFLADGMGLGKSRQAIMAADAIDAVSVLVLCPSVARTNWAAEWERFSDRPRKVQVLEKLKDKPTGDVIIASYDYASSQSGKHLLMGRSLDALIVDEAHFIKNRDAKRTKAVYGHLCRGKNALIQNAKYVWLLSGTPMPNNASELWTHMRALWPALINEQRLVEFIDRYCKTYQTQFGAKITGNRNVDELKAKLTGIMLRRTAEKVLPELPPIVWDEYTLDDVDAKPVLEAEKDVQVVALRHAIATGGDIDLQSAGLHLQSIRRITGTVKAAPSAELIRQMLTEDTDSKVIVFAIHSDVVAVLKDRLADFGAVELTGKTAAAKRDAHIEAFRTDPSCRVFIGQIHACGTAINLQVANRVVFAEFDWVPANNLQAAKRAHRIGQTKPVFVTLLHVPGTTDQLVSRLVTQKLEQINEILGD